MHYSFFRLQALFWGVDIDNINEIEVVDPAGLGGADVERKPDCNAKFKLYG